MGKKTSGVNLPPPARPSASVVNIPAANALKPFVTRGRAAWLAAHPEDTNVAARVGGHTMDVILLVDFVANVEVFIRHVVANGRPIHILNDKGAICARLEKDIRRSAE